MLEPIFGALLGPVKDLALALLGREILGKVMTVWYGPALVLLSLVGAVVIVWAHRSDKAPTFSLRSLQGLVATFIAAGCFLLWATIIVIGLWRGSPPSLESPPQHYAAPDVKRPSATHSRTAPAAKQPYELPSDMTTP